MPSSDSSQEIQKEIEPKKTSNSKDRFWVKTIPFFIVIIILFCITAIGHGIYKDSWFSKTVRSIAYTIHFPVALAGSHVVTYTEFKDAADEYGNYVDTGFGLDSIIQSDSSLDQVMLTKVIKDEFLDQAYKDHSISVSTDEVSQAFESIFGSPPDSKDAQKLVEETLGTTPDILVAGILSEYVSKQKLTRVLYASDELINVQQKVLEDFREKLLTSPELVDNYINGTSSEKGVSFRYAGLMDPSQLNGDLGELKSLDKGDFSSVIKNTNRFSMYRIMRKISDAEGVKFLELQEFYVKKIGAEELISEEMSSAKIFILSPYYSWAAPCQVVVAYGESCSSDATVTQDTLSLPWEEE